MCVCVCVCVCVSVCLISIKSLYILKWNYPNKRLNAKLKIYVNIYK